MSTRLIKCQVGGASRNRCLTPWCQTPHQKVPVAGQARRAPRRCRRRCCGGMRRHAQIAVALRSDDLLIPKRSNELRGISRPDADERTPPAGYPRGVTTTPPEFVDPADQPLVQLRDMTARLRDPDLLHQLDPGDARIDRGDGRRPRLEPPRRRRRRVVADVHLEDVLVGKPPGLRRQELLREAGPRPHGTRDRPSRASTSAPRRRGTSTRARAHRADRCRSTGRRRAGRVHPARGRSSRSPRRRAGIRSGNRRQRSRRPRSARRSQRRSARPESRHRRRARGRPAPRAAPARARSARSCEIRVR